MIIISVPTKNSVKTYIVNGVYHIYNRGVEKRKIFVDEQDYEVFLYYLKSYLLPLNKQINPPYNIKNFQGFSLYKEVKLIAYVLMPTHFHLMIKQLSEKGMIEFMKRLSNAYVRYFNDKYKRVGALFQGRYKAALIEKENHYLHLTRYIHLNPLELFNEDRQFSKLKEYEYSSYLDYVGKRNTSWLCKEEMLECFSKNKDQFGLRTYQEFVEEHFINSQETLENLTIEQVRPARQVAPA